MLQENEPSQDRIAGSLDLPQEPRLITRRQLLMVPVAAAASSLLSACTPATSSQRTNSEVASADGIATPTAVPLVLHDNKGYQLTEVTIDGRVKTVDQQLEESAGLVQRLRFDYDLNYPSLNMQNGSVGLEVALTQDGAVRMMTEELAKRPRFLLNDTCPYLVNAGESLYRHPYTEVEKGDIGRIYVGFGSDTYQDMRIYEVQRDENREVIIAKFMGITPIDPSKLPPPEQPPRPCPPNFPEGIR